MEFGILARSFFSSLNCLFEHCRNVTGNEGRQTGDDGMQQRSLAGLEPGMLDILPGNHFPFLLLLWIGVQYLAHTFTVLK